MSASIILILGLMLALLLAVSACATATPTPEPTPTPYPTYTLSPTQTPYPTYTPYPPPDTPVPTPTLPYTTLPTPVISIVGKDINPGTYIAQWGTQCYWERLRGLSGQPEDIIDSQPEDIMDKSYTGEEIVTIEATDLALATYGCGDWAPAPPVQASDIALTIALPRIALPPSCDDFVKSILELSADEKIQILDIYYPRELERSDNFLSCKARAATNTYLYVQLIYSYEIDQEGNAVIKYRGDSYDPTATPTA